MYEFRGCQTRTNPTTAAADNNEATTSASGTDRKFDVAYCATANTTPQTNATGHVSRMPRQPSTIMTRANGTNSARIGVCRPTIAPSVSTGNSVTLPSVMIGVAMAPNATGAVLATRASTAALSGLKPSAISITDVTATGVPKPANASISAPKENAMMMAWIRWSSLTELKERRRTSKCPVSTVIWYTQMALMTIHRIGKNPNAAPSDPASRVCPTGMP